MANSIIERPAAASAATAPLRILVMGSPAFLSDVVAKLGAAGCQAKGVSDEELAQVASQWQPHLTLIEPQAGGAGLAEAIARLRRAHACACALVATNTTAETLSLADRAGADTVVVPPFDVQTLKGLAQFPVGAQTGPEAARLPRLASSPSSAMAEVWRVVLRAAPSDSSVIISGETGVGKEVVARALHRFSARRSGPFVAINCAAIPETLLESELFGHEKGSFTGASAQHKGRFELAHGGTLFLDEIGDLSLPLQVKLLRFLQERTFERVGGTESIATDVRVLAATHRRLEEEVQRGRFRSDLFYRLNVLSVNVPALRERKAEILALWEQSLEQNVAAGRPPPSTSTAVQRLLLKHEWPGNVRELHNVAQHALTMATGESLLPADLPAYLTGPQTARQELNLAGMTLREIERLAILQTCEAIGTVTQAASVLGISARKIHYRLKEYRAAGRDVLRPDDLQAATPRQRIRILLAEDDDDLRWALCDSLQEEGYEVLPVADGRALLERLGAAMLLGDSEFPADVILTDHRMPGLTGLEILGRVRERGWKVPVVVMTAYSDGELRRQAEELGAVFVEKPIDIGALRSILASSVQ
jgi:DNA-binding NtrC family response regulator